MTQFSELSISAVLKGNLARHGFKQPTPVQQQSIEPALAGRDVVATAQTGTGKTLAFVLPILERLGQQPGRGVQALILSPTRELALQIDETFRKIAAGTGIRSAVAVGGLNENKQLNAIRQGAQVVIATPGRLCDFLGRNLVRLDAVRILVLDEADRMLDMGFLPAIHRITAAIPAGRQTLFFSATIESSVKHLVESHVKDAVRVAIGSITKPAEQVDLFLYEVEQNRKSALLESMLREEEGTFLVFARTKHGAERLSKRLGQSGFKTASIHGDRTQNQRNQALRGFQNGTYRVLVATDVAARGIHVEGISHVVNYDLPQVPEDFIHRVGRTGRAGARGTASTFASCTERSEIQRIERTIGKTLTHRGVANEAPAQHQQGAPVIVLTPAVQRAAKWRSFRPARRRSV
jgi:ATP-dependent RNA helicase RhlE